MMTQLKKKPKPFKAMKKVLCGDVQSRRLMVFASLILVMLGCFTLYTAMENENWTQDEPTQRQVFLLASLLMITSIALCYYALNGELLDDKERTEMESNHLASIKYGDYNSIKSGPLVPTYPQPQINSRTEDRLLELLEPRLGYQEEVESRKSNDTKSGEQKRRMSQYIKPEELSNSCCCKSGEHHSYSIQESNNSTGTLQENTNSDQTEKRNRSLIVELMPLLPLQLCERELSNLNIPQLVVDNLQEQLQFPLTEGQINPNLTNPFSQANKNSDAG